MDAKKKLIQEAYGEHWDKVKDFVDINTGVAEIPSTINRTDYLKQFELLGTYPNSTGFYQLFIPKSLRMFNHNNGWTKIEEKLPEQGLEVLCFNKNWICEDFNPNGTRIGFLNGDNEFTTAHWWAYQDTYMTISKYDCKDEIFSENIKNNTEPTHWRSIEKPPIY